ncbi:hypothetical protein CSUB01_07539 [Colletotrichum sublineola]|uniref:Uncharacterized protein n=1 Tax=Colletotrichum sublineola TaxID=1173701 RepID=A0A066XGU5_COLSU|nr:hypothetical protein CSUB01_07539 [Colletotrichum sublineola]
MANQHGQPTRDGLYKYRIKSIDKQHINEQSTSNIIELNTMPRARNRHTTPQTTNSDRERRMSIGGQAPVRFDEEYVVEQIPSHDGKPFFTAWVRRWYPKPPAHFTPEQLNQDSALAESLHRDTLEMRWNRDKRDRIDVCGMPLPVGLSDEEKAAKCKAHAVAEIASRKAGGAGPDLEFSPLQGYSRWKRGIIVIDKPRERWNEDERGGLMEVYWDRRPGDGDQDPEAIVTCRVPEDELDGTFQSWGFAI